MDIAALSVRAAYNSGEITYGHAVELLQRQHVIDPVRVLQDTERFRQDTKVRVDMG